MINKIKELFKPNTRWQDMYEEKRKESRTWEFKYNKLSRQLRAILDEAES
jgi:hypothetical protein